MDLLSGLDIVRVVVQYTVLLISLCFHEAAHAWMADRQGDPTARYLGRVSLNPVVHADLLGTVIFPLMVMFFNTPLIGWAKPVPVNPSRLRRPRHDHMLIAAAGPGSNFLLGTGCVILLLMLKSTVPEVRFLLGQVAGGSISYAGSTLLVPLVGILFYGVLINFALAFFNILPIPPLDGNWILAGLLPHTAGRVLHLLQPYGFIILYGLMFMGMLRVVFIPVYVILGFLIS